MVEAYYKDALVEIWCGDSRELLPLLPKVDLVVADPPYGMALDASYSNSTANKRKGIGPSRGYDAIVGDNEPFDPSPFLGLCSEQFWFGADYYADKLPSGGSWLVWDKREGIESVKYSASEFELIWSKKKRLRAILRQRWFGLCGMETQDVGQRMHPAQKPIELITKLLLLVNAPLVLDPFMGSGTALRAAKELNRKAIGIEIEERYCEIAAKRCESIQAGLFDTPVVPVVHEPQAGLFSE